MASWARHHLNACIQSWRSQMLSSAESDHLLLPISKWKFVPQPATRARLAYALRTARVESRRNAGLDHSWFLFFKPLTVHWLGGGATPTNESDQPSPTQQCAEILLSPFSTHMPGARMTFDSVEAADRQTVTDRHVREISVSIARRPLVADVEKAATTG